MADDRPMTATEDAAAPMSTGIAVQAGATRVAEPAASRLIHWWVPLTLFAPGLIVVGVIGQFQLFPHPSWVDPAIYLGYFLNLEQLIGRFGNTYFVLRLGFTLTGFTIHSIFSPRLAHLIMVFGFHSLAVASIYAILRPRFGIAAGLIGAAMLGLNPIFVTAVTGNYVDGAAIAVSFAALAALWSIRYARHKRALAVLTGALCVVGANMHPTVVLILVAPMLLGALDLIRRDALRVYDLGFFVAGALVAEIGFSLVAMALGLPFFYYLNILEVTPLYLSLGARYQRPIMEWLPQTFRLHVVPLAAVFAVASLVASRAGGEARRFLAWQLAFLAAITGAMVAFDFGHGGALLQSPFYGSYLLIPVCLTLGAAFGQSLALEQRPFAAPLAAWLAIVAIAVVICLEPWIAPWAADQALTFALFIAGGSAVVVILLVLGQAHRPARVAAAVFGATLAAALWTANVDTGRVFLRYAGIDYVHFYNVAINFVRFIETADTRDRRLLIWFDRDRFTTQDPQRDLAVTYSHSFLGQAWRFTFFDALSGLYLWDRSQIASPLPALSASDSEILRFSRAPVTVVALGMLAEDGDLAAAALGNAGVSTRLRGATVLRDGPVRIRVWLYDVTNE